jgi:thymidylate synthase ThyX
MPTTAKVVQDSISESGQRLVTMVLEYPRIIHSEFMTHRDFSRNASSSRAIPVSDNIKRVESDGFTPAYLGKNQKGMQAFTELHEWEKEQALLLWEEAKENAVLSASLLSDKGVHKQLSNRVLEPFNYIQVVVTATEWDNFFLQRLDKNAQPEIQELARVMALEMTNSVPKLLKAGEWHLPFISENDIAEVHQYVGFKQPDEYENICRVGGITDLLIKISVARCARVSYGLNERGWGDIQKDLDLYDILSTNNHWSPFEHQATPTDNRHWYEGITHLDRKGSFWSGNFGGGWIQNRQLIQQSRGQV